MPSRIRTATDISGKIGTFMLSLRRFYGGSPIPAELLDRAVWRFLKGKRHLTASASLYTNRRTAIGPVAPVPGAM